MLVVLPQFVSIGFCSIAVCHCCCAWALPATLVRMAKTPRSIMESEIVERNVVNIIV
jgi:hypothetical protein